MLFRSQRGGGETTPNPYDDDYDRKSFLNEGDRYDGDLGGTHHFDDDQSIAPSGYAPSRPMFDPLGTTEKDTRGVAGAAEVVEEVGQTTARRNWVILTWLATWWIPSFCLSWCGGMKRKDVRMAWREKLLIKCVAFTFWGGRALTAVYRQHAHLAPLRHRHLRHRHPREPHRALALSFSHL